MHDPAALKYLHGYQTEEQERLREQAKVIEKPIYDYIDFSDATHVLEIGSGVGAQTEILLRRFPHLRITGVEYEKKQIEKAYGNMAELGYGQDKVDFLHQDAKNLQLKQQYDGVFICWVLEHISNPIEVLQRMKPFLQPHAKVIITEVFNDSFYTFPENEEVMRYWKIYNDYQTAIGGDPQVGAKLGNLLADSGYRQIELRMGGFHLDKRHAAERASVFTYWKNLMSSGAPALLAEGLVAPTQIKSMQRGMDDLQNQPDSIFHYNFIQATAFA